MKRFLLAIARRDYDRAGSIDVKRGWAAVASIHVDARFRGRETKFADGYGRRSIRTVRDMKPRCGGRRADADAPCRKCCSSTVKISAVDEIADV